MKAPAFQFYADDFLAGTIHFTDAEAGLYMRLLCVQWSAGSIPDDDGEIASYGRGPTPIVRVKAKFKKGEDGLLRNVRLEQERDKQTAHRNERAEAGKRGAKRRWNGSAIAQPSPQNGSAIVLPLAKDSSPSPSPSPILPEEPTVEPSAPPVGSENNTGPMLSEAEENRQIDLDNAKLLLEFLNAKAFRNFRPGPVHLQFITARLAEPGVEPAQCEKMIARMVKLWLGTSQEEYLQPSTLFGKTNFAKYYDKRDLPVGPRKEANCL